MIESSEFRGIHTIKYNKILNIIKEELNIKLLLCYFD